MIEYIRGAVTELNPAAVVVECGSGVAYRMNISLATYSAIENKPEIKLYVHEIIREDSWLLYGFDTIRERELFRALIGVSGVGAATAVLILSALQGNDLVATISTGDVKRLKAIKGIGSKTAERIVVDLRDKIGEPDNLPSAGTASPTVAEFDEALAAMTMLGFDRKLSHKALKQIFDSEPRIRAEAAIKKALTMM